MRFTVRNDLTEAVAAALAKRSNAAEHLLATQVQKDTSPYVPFKTGKLDQETRVIGNTIIYPAPRSRYLYYGMKMYDPATGKGAMHYIDRHGNEVFRFRYGAKLRPTSEPLTYTKDFHKLAGSHWFERSKANNLQKWLQYAKRAVLNG